MGLRMSDVWGIVWLVVLLLANAFFVAAEFAVISARRSQIEPLAEAGKRSAKTALHAMERASDMLATSQLGITVCSLLILNVAEPSIHHLLAKPMELFGWSTQLIDTVAFVVTLLIVSYLHVVFGEMVPKNLSFSVPDRAVLLLAPPLVLCAKLMKPVIVVLNLVANGLLRLLGIEPKVEANSTFTLEEVATIVNQSTREGVLVDSTGALSAAFEFTEKTVNDVRIINSDLVTLPEATATPRDVEQAVAKHGFSRYVLVNDDAEPVAYVHLKDIIDLDDDELDEPIPAKRIRRLVSLLDTTQLEDALARLQRSGEHVARLIDAAGHTTGAIFLEDIVEELVGEVHDATRRGYGSGAR